MNKNLKVALTAALIEGAYGESSRSIGNSTSPTGESVDKRVSTALSKKRSTGAGDGWITFFGYTRADIHMLHSDGYTRKTEERRVTQNMEWDN